MINLKNFEQKLLKIEKIRIYDIGYIQLKKNDYESI